MKPDKTRLLEAIQVESLADDALLMRLGDRIDSATNARVHALCERIRARPPAWLRDLVPAYASVGAFFDPLAVEADHVGRWLRTQLEALPIDIMATRDARTVEIPVTYGGDAGPDLESAAAELGMTPTQLARRHAAGEYTVAMIGFAPGFPYLLGLDPALALPRLATPRTVVPAGSVGIGGAQTGIYPRESPGGWRVIGRTPLALFDPTREPPALLAPGDRVRFVAVERS
ncbi:KipI family sensor histidine kinase inhibitor [Lysobacter niabensis]|uniref:KipI family sensor histidine kinase inhibitor n=1 Tax=Agrilutibacter niabensis TaxID=380628 RepID=A0ABU1VNQ1_9GAMM|nr:5-oxoprolinase subunit PxpB [Lysobacter niabensis]MDR7099097.1 KipI family sensor histidine kinase inhibitor [Lysobacter niabensis]